MASWQFGQKVETERTSLSLDVTGAKPMKRTSPSGMPPPQPARNAAARNSAAWKSFIGFSFVCPPYYFRGNFISTLLRTAPAPWFWHEIAQNPPDPGRHGAPGPGGRLQDLRMRDGLPGRPGRRVRDQR